MLWSRRRHRSSPLKIELSWRSIEYLFLGISAFPILASYVRAHHLLSLWLESFLSANCLTPSFDLVFLTKSLSACITCIVYETMPCLFLQRLLWSRPGLGCDSRLLLLDYIPFVLASLLLHVSLRGIQYDLRNLWGQPCWVYYRQLQNTKKQMALFLTRVKLSFERLLSIISSSEFSLVCSSSIFLSFGRMVGFSRKILRTFNSYCFPKVNWKAYDKKSKKEVN